MIFDARFFVCFIVLHRAKEEKIERQKTTTLPKCAKIKQMPIPTEY